MSEESKATEQKPASDPVQNPGTGASPGQGSKPGRQRRQRTEYRSDGEAAKKGLRFIILPAVGLAVLGLGAWLLARPVWQKVREYRGHTFAVRAGESFKAGRITESVKLLRTALAMAPLDMATLANAAEILSTEDVPDALDFWQKLFQRGSGTLEDHLRYVALAARLHRFELASSELNRLLAANPKNFVVKQTLVELSVLAGDFGTAVSQIRELAVADPGPSRQILLGSTLIRASGFAIPKEAVKLAQEGAEVLIPLATQPGPFQSTAAIELAENVRLEGEAVRVLISSLEKKSPPNTFDVRALALFRIQNDPARAETYASQMAQDLSIAPLNERIRAADWLLAHGSLEPAKKLIRPEDSRTNYTARLMEVDIASLRGDWPFIRQLLVDTNVIRGSTIRASLEAAVAAGEGATQKADSLFRTAMDEALTSRAPDAELQYIAKMAERSSDISAAIAAHESRLRFGSSVPNASENILRLVVNSQPLVRLFPALEARHRLMPEDLPTSSQYFFLCALLGRNLEEAKQGLTTLFQAYPDRPEPILGLALVAIRTGAAGLAEATTLLEEHPVDFDALPIRLKAAHVHVLGRIGRKDEARTHANKIDLKSLYPEEQELLEPWLAR